MATKQHRVVDAQTGEEGIFLVGYDLHGMSVTLPNGDAVILDLSGRTVSINIERKGGDTKRIDAVPQGALHRPTDRRNRTKLTQDSRRAESKFLEGDLVQHRASGVRGVIAGNVDDEPDIYDIYVDVGVTKRVSAIEIELVDHKDQHESATTYTTHFWTLPFDTKFCLSGERLIKVDERHAMAPNGVLRYISDETPVEVCD